MERREVDFDAILTAMGDGPADNVNRLLPGEFTAQEYAVKSGLAVSGVYAKLRDKLDAGVLIARKVRLNGRSTNAYSLNKQGEEDSPC